MQGADKLKQHLKPNETPVEVKEETQQNIRKVKTVAGRQSLGNVKQFGLVFSEYKWLSFFADALGAFFQT